MSENAPSRSSLQVKPCVIPQTSTSLRGAFFSPFVRAYSSVISDAGISLEDFVSFIDKLNEVFIASPVLQMTGLLGGAMAAVPFHPVQLAGMGVQVASGLCSATMSYTRTRHYLREANRDLFHPRELHCTIMSTKRMLAKLGLKREDYKEFWSQMSEMPLEVAQSNEGYPPETYKAGCRGRGFECQDTRMHRHMALQGYAAPLQTEGLPERVFPSNIIERLNGKFAARQESKQLKDIKKERFEGSKKMFEKLQEAQKEWQHEQKKVEKLENQMLDLDVHHARKLETLRGETKKSDLEKKYVQEMHKLENETIKALHERDKKSGEKQKEALKEWKKVINKERAAAQKIRWIVICRIDEQPPSDESESDQ